MNGWDHPPNTVVNTLTFAICPFISRLERQGLVSISRIKNSLSSLSSSPCMHIMSMQESGITYILWSGFLFHTFLLGLISSVECVSPIVRHGHRKPYPHESGPDIPRPAMVSLTHNWDDGGLMHEECCNNDKTIHIIPLGEGCFTYSDIFTFFPTLRQTFGGPITVYNQLSGGSIIYSMNYIQGLDITFYMWLWNQKYGAIQLPTKREILKILYSINGDRLLYNITWTCC